MNILLVKRNINKYRLRERYENFMFYYVFPIICIFGLIFQFIYHKIRRLKDE
jgi:hypothetical protein